MSVPIFTSEEQEVILKFFALWKGDMGRYRCQLWEMRENFGTTISRPDLIVWGFPVNMKEVLNGPRPARIRTYQNPDAWFVWACAGDIRRIPEVIPYRLPHIIFARDNGELRAYDYDRLIGKIKSRSNEKLTKTNS